MLLSCLLHVCVQCVGHFTPTAAAMPGSSSSSGIGSDCITGVAFADDGRQVLANHLGEMALLTLSYICKDCHASVGMAC